MDFLIRLAGEVTVKSASVRRFFQRRLVDNIRDALAAHQLKGTVAPAWSRLYVSGSQLEAQAVLQRIFGISSFSKIDLHCTAELETIVREGLAYYRDKVQGVSFAVKARRHGSQAYRSLDVEKELGAVLKQAGGRVQLTAPEFCVYVEVRGDECFFYSEILSGAGGLPLGTAGASVCLMSGGFDSAVAAWMLQKRGVTCHFLLCNLAGAAYERAVLNVAKVLADQWTYGYQPFFHVVAIQDLVAEIKAKVAPRFTQLILKRIFYRLGALLAEEVKAEALVTGEAIGQVSSQTLPNLRAIDAAARGRSTHFPVLRPLVAFDKEEIIKLSRHIGTFALSAKIQEFCHLGAEKPATAAKEAELVLEEKRLDAGLISAAFAARKVFDLRALSQQELSTAYLFKATVPPAAVVIDCRPWEEFHKGHWPGAQHRDYIDLLEGYRQLDKGATYLLYCALGIQSAVIAEKMQKDGYDAYSLSGGSRGLL